MVSHSSIIRPLTMRMLCLFILMQISTGLADASTNAEAVIAAEKARNAALIAGDADRLAALLSDNLRYIHSTGKLQTKTVVLDEITSQQTAYARMITSDLVTDEIAPNVVVLSGKIDQRKLGNGKWRDLVLLFQAVWRNEADSWRLVNLQTVLPPPPTP